MGEPEDELGGDPACWSHLFDDPVASPLYTPTDLTAIAEHFPGRGPAWSTESADLNVTLVIFAAGDGVPDHVNTELDVLLVGVSGEGTVRVDGEAHPLVAGQLVLVPKGAVRGTTARSVRFAYLSCHRRRGGLMPQPRPSRS